MAMPKAAVHKDDCMIMRKNNIRVAGQPSVILAEAEAQSVQGRADGKLRRSILTVDSSHIGVALRFSERVHKNAVYHKQQIKSAWNL